ncbi:RNA polymerase sigma-70 factor, ECF subfamily [Fodinibius roseus]|uniref:RNA polymerase sigma-70 factor, ECF subfamily n=1 Tax=Fodinibius roseus TaxID=1194090 RepID=A0A1M5EZB8_9BACT|nr:RNA polymerase sigma-70 factor [Fodinibius roseus]SHF84352.1 RNA polymerase sigma-70 factor, ECF subfamily [Fodinibius roseus]
MDAEDYNEKNWIDNVQQGDEKAFERLFKKYFYDLSRFAWRYVKSKAVAEELVQEVFADIWDNRKVWNPTSSLKLYLYQSVKHQALDYLKHEQVRDEYDPQWREKREHPTIRLQDTRREEQIRKAINKEIEALPPRSKMTYKLHRHDGLTYKEIAEVMDVSVKTVESQMTRTLKRLRKRLSYLLPFLLIASLTV